MSICIQNVYKINIYYKIVKIRLNRCFNTTLNNTSKHEIQEKDTELQLVIGMFRHGDRTPERDQMRHFPKYREKNNNFEPYGPGALTTIGKKAMYDLGENLKIRYAKSIFNQDKFHANQVLMEATEYPRCLISAYLVLGGLTNSDKDSLLKKNWQQDKKLKDIWNPEKEDLLKFYYEQPTCVAFMNKLEETLKDRKSDLNRCNSSFELMHNALGVESPNPFRVWEMFEIFKAQTNAGVQLPSYVTSEIVEKMKECIHYFLNISFETTCMKKMSGGIYVDMVLQQCEDFINNKDKLKNKRLRLFCGHDTTIAPALAALGGNGGYIRYGHTFLVDVPDYGALILFELHKDNKAKRHFVKLYYLNGKEDLELAELKLKDCPEEKCYLEEYIKIVEQVRIDKDKLFDCSNVSKKKTAKHK